MKGIDIHDNVLGYNNAQLLLSYLQSSFFQTTAVDAPDTNFSHHTSMLSSFNKLDVKNSGFFDYLPDDIKEKHPMISMDSMWNCNVNLITPSDRFHVHTDAGYTSSGTTKKTLLYYPTPNWNVEYGGDTLFLDEKGEDICYYCQYKTDRLVLFDSIIPHLIRPSTWLSPYYRMSFVMKFI